MNNNTLMNVRSTVPHHRKDTREVISKIINNATLLYCTAFVLSLVVGGMHHVY